MASSERGAHIGITASFENVSQRNKTLHMFKTNDETRKNFSDEESELSVPQTHLDRRSHRSQYLQLHLQNVTITKKVIRYCRYTTRFTHVSDTIQARSISARIAFFNYVDIRIYEIEKYHYQLFQHNTYRRMKNSSLPIMST